jgi:hypothetical protein
MIETNTSWQDSGFDCDHCGGEIAKRTDRETGQSDRVCYQCRQCGCQWSLNGSVMRIGNSRYCEAAQRERMGTKATDFLVSRRVLIVLGILLILAVLRFGGFGAFAMLLRFLLPVALVAVIVMYVVRYGREQEWW